MFTEVIFDVETKKLFSDISGNDPGDLGVSIVSAYHRTITPKYKEIEGKLKSYWEKDFSKLWPLFSKADRIVGFNSTKFDILALQPYAPFKLSKLNHFDIMSLVKEKLGRRISLDSIAKETLGQGKTGIGVQAVYYWREKSKESLEKLKKYCEADVIITKDIYDYGLKNKYVKYLDKWNTPREIEVDFSYSREEKETKKQDSLF